jgi:UDP-glucose 4-epimerase
MTTVMITGVSRDLASRFARALAADADTTVIGVDVVPPRHDLGRAGFIRADIRAPIIGKVIDSDAVDIVVHMAVLAAPARTGGRSSMKEINVIGTMQLLAACQKAESVRKFVVQGSVSVYGSTPRDPARFTEEMGPRASLRSGFGKDSAEIESYVRGYARRLDDGCVTTLRLAPLMGAGVDSTITAYLGLPVVPKVAGFDARLQFLHPTDAVEALLTVTRDDLPGIFNVAADDVVLLSQALRTLGRPWIEVPRPAAPLLAGLARRAGFAEISDEQLDVLTYGRAMDSSRFVAATGWRPRYGSAEALAEWAAPAGPGLLGPDRADRLVDAAARLLTGRRASDGV